MCDGERNIKLEVNENKVVVTMEAWSIWDILPEEEKEYVLRDSAYWGVVEKSLEYELGRSPSSPHYNSSIHKLREKIVTDTNFVNDITVTFIETILEEWAKAVQAERKADKAFWTLYHQVQELQGYNRPRIECPNDFKEDDDYMSISTKAVKEEIMDKFKGLLKEVRKKMDVSTALSWNELADIYNKSTGGCAQRYRMNTIFEWAERQTDKFFVSEDGSLHLLKDKENKQ